MKPGMNLELAVVGGGTMGAGIAYVSAQAGGRVFVVEPDDARAEGLKRTIQGAVASAIKRGKMDDEKGRALAARIERVASVERLPAGLDLVAVRLWETVTGQLRATSSITA